MYVTSYSFPYSFEFREIHYKNNKEDKGRIKKGRIGFIQGRLCNFSLVMVKENTSVVIMLSLFEIMFQENSLLLILFLVSCNCVCFFIGWFNNTV